MIKYQIINMAKVSIINIEIVNPKDIFTNPMNIKIHLKSLSHLEEGSLIRFGIHGYLCWLCG